MNKTTALQFIERTIDKTKSQQLHWERMDSHFNLKNTSSEFSIIPENMPHHLIEGGYCYIANYKTGFLIFLTFAPYELKYLNPPKDHGFSLRVQDNTTTYAEEISHSGVDIELSSQLIRLFNLLDIVVPKPLPNFYEKDLDALSLIQDFLNS